MCETSAYVLVLYDFEYEAADGNQVMMKEGEEFLLVNKTNNDWWQVLRDGDSKPFYAPATYMEELSFEQKQNASNQKQVLKDSVYVLNMQHKSDGSENNNNENKPPGQPRTYDKLNRLNSEGKNYHGLLFNNPLYSVDETEADGSPVEPEVDYSDEESRKQSNDGNANGHKTEDMEVAQGVTACEIVKARSPTRIEESLQNRASISPIYANLPLNTVQTPPSPTGKETPTRILLHHWAEYEDPNGRKYYYNRITREKSWKPPRRRSEKLSTSSHSLDSSSSLTEDIEINTVTPSQSSTQESISMPIPSGWTQDVDKESEELCYVNDITKAKWFTSTDEQGRLYYYQENASESYWQLPEVIITEGDKKEVELKSTSVAGDKSTNSPHTSPTISPKLRRPVPLRPASLADRGLKARSMILTDSRCSSLPRNSSALQLFNAHAAHMQIFRQGLLNKTKFMEGGKRLRKNWCASFLILSDVLLLFYKDMKSAQLNSSTSKPEICIDLAGALIEWTSEKSSRKNVFLISTVLGLQILIHDDNYQTSKEWYEAIRSAIAKLPSGITSSITNPSIAQDSSMASPEENKKSFRLTRKFKSSGSQEDLGSTPAERKIRIRDKLINFFLRRPSIDLLRERGIIKEEPVFGCNLHNLCAREKSTVPRFVQRCTQLIELKDMKADGLYRASGNLSQVQKIRFQVNQVTFWSNFHETLINSFAAKLKPYGHVKTASPNNLKYNLACLDAEDDVHVLTGALKMFFRELKEPLIPFNIFENFLALIMNPDKAAKLRSFSEFVSSLPRPNYDTIKSLFQHLLRVTEYSEFNRMHIQNLAIVFGPTLMWPEMESKNLALDMIQQNQIIEYLLLEFNTLFS